jgi:hypothetical protein
MSYSVETLKGVISEGRGIARNNRYMMVIPVRQDLAPSGLNVTAVNVLCKNINLPGTQIITHERPMGINLERIGYGYTQDDLNVTFIGLNDYKIRQYLHRWHTYIASPDQNVVRYKNDYCVDISIHPMDMQGETVYHVVLKDAFPTQLLGIDMTNELDGVVDVGATFAYTNWSSYGTSSS